MAVLPFMSHLRRPEKNVPLAGEGRNWHIGWIFRTSSMSTRYGQRDQCQGQQGVQRPGVRLVPLQPPSLQQNIPFHTLLPRNRESFNFECNVSKFSSTDISLLCAGLGSGQ